MDYIKHLYRDTTIGHWLFNSIKKLKDFINSRILPEKLYRKRIFKNIYGYNLDLENPKTIQEKINWLQLNDRTQLHTLCTDKYAVREYVKEKIGEQYLIPLVLHSTNPKDIVSENLPDYPFIIKTNHGSRGHVIVRDKSKIDWKSVQKNLKKSLKSNFYYNAREWQYKNIKPRIIVEKLLLDKNNNIPYDYKFICYNGHVAFIEVIIDRHTDIKSNFYDSDWKIVKYEGFFKSGNDFKRPVNFSKMKSTAEILAKDFRFLRVDLYDIESKIYFGEMTFSPVAGFEPFPPLELVKKLGINLEL